MATPINEIRQWGRENGWDVEDGGRLPTGLRAAYDSRSTDSDAYFPGDEPTTEFTLPPVQNDGIEEIPPQIKPESLKDRGKTFLDRVKKVAPETAKTRGRKAAKPRVGIDKLISMGWRFLAQMAQPISLPVARVLDMQAPVAGAILEDTVKGTIIDRLLQPLARAEAGGETVFALLGPPLLVGAITAKPEMFPVLRPVLRESLMLWVQIAGPKIKEQMAKEEKFKEEYGTEIDDMINLFFAPPPGQEYTQ